MNWKYIKSVSAAAGFILAAFGTGLGTGFYFDQPQGYEIPVENPVNVELATQLGIAQAEIAELSAQEPIVDVQVEYVDNGNLETVLDYVYENDGQVEFLLDDLDDDEVGLIVDRIAFINEIKDLAINEVKDSGIDELNKEVYTYADNSTIKFDDDDIERFRVKSDFDDLNITDVDFEDSDANILVTAKFEQDDDKFEADFSVEFRDGVVDDLSLVEIRER